MTTAPDFSLPDQDGQVHSLADYKGRWLVLYFYPKDNSPGCRAEACEFRDEHLVIGQFGNAAVIGVSRDSVASHKAFAIKHHLQFPLLSDPSHHTIEAYGAWERLQLLKGAYHGIIRSTFIISPDGQVAKRYRNVVPRGHAAQIINDLHSLQAASINI